MKVIVLFQKWQQFTRMAVIKGHCSKKSHLQLDAIVKAECGRIEKAVLKKVFILAFPGIFLNKLFGKSGTAMRQCHVKKCYKSRPCMDIIERIFH